MDTATRDRNIATWLGDAPQPVRDTTNQLLERIALCVPSRLSTRHKTTSSMPSPTRRPTRSRLSSWVKIPITDPNRAMGLSFSVPATQTKLPPSLRNIYKELKADLGCPIPATGDLTPWAQQGVLLLNTTLTVREHAANSHAKLGWSTLTDYVIERCCQLPQPVVFLAWGRFAQQMVEGKLAATGAGKATGKFCTASTHPSPLSANRATAELPTFMGSRPFSAANRLLEQHGSTPSTGLASAKNRYIKNAPDGDLAIGRVLLLGPNKLCAAGLAAIDQQTLPGHKPVGHAHKVDPLGDLLGGGPALKRRELHNLVPQLFVFHHATVERRDNAARVHTVGDGLRCRAVCKVLGVGDNAALAGGIGGKLRSRMPARRPHIDHGFNSRRRFGGKSLPTKA